MDDKLPIDYWITGATTLPVLALALIIEARAVEGRMKSVPAWIQAFQYVTWSALLLSAGILELAAFKAIRGNRLDAFWPAYLEAIVAGFLGALILFPALSYLASGVAASWFSARYGTLKGGIAVLRIKLKLADKKQKSLRAGISSMLDNTAMITDRARSERDGVVDLILQMNPNVDFESINKLYAVYYSLDSVVQKGLRISEFYREREVADDSDAVTPMETDEAQSESLDYRLFEKSE